MQIFLRIYIIEKYVPLMLFQESTVIVGYLNCLMKIYFLS